MQRFGMMTRIIAVALGAVIAFAALSYTSAQQEPPHRFYGTDGTAGDTIGVMGADGAMLGSATVAADGSWYVDVDRDAAEGATFTINGEAATADTSSTGAGQTQVSNVQAIPPPPPPPAPEPEPVCPDDGMMEEDSLEGDDSMMADDSMESDDSMMSDDDDAMMSDDDDAMLDCPEEGDEDDSMMDDGDDAMLDEDVGMPATGTGGLADGGLSAGLIGLLIALGAATIAGLGIRRVRNRA